MKAIPQSKSDKSSTEFIKKKKNKLNGVSKNEVGNGDVVNGKEHKSKNKIEKEEPKSKDKKLKKLLKNVEEVKNLIQKPKKQKGEKKVEANGSVLTTSELLLSLKFEKPNKIKSKKSKEESKPKKAVEENIQVERVDKKSKKLSKTDGFSTKKFDEKKQKEQIDKKKEKKLKKAENKQNEVVLSNQKDDTEKPKKDKKKKNKNKSVEPTEQDHKPKQNVQTKQEPPQPNKKQKQEKNKNPENGLESNHNQNKKKNKKQKQQDNPQAPAQQPKNKNVQDGQNKKKKNKGNKNQPGQQNKANKGQPNSKFEKPNEIKKKKVKKVLTGLQPSLKEAPEFDAVNFNKILTLENVTKCVKTLITTAEKETSEKKKLMFKDYRVMLDVTMFKIPSAPKRQVKMKLTHSLVGPEDDVCLIVRDLQRGTKVDFEPTIHYYEDILRERGITNIKTIMPFNQLKKEYGSYEMKKKLCNLYDYFICDSAISEHAFGFLGKIFHSKLRGVLHTVRMKNVNGLKKEIKKALKKTCFIQGGKGQMVSVLVGTDTLSEDQIAENIKTVINNLSTLLPGGHPNIRNLMIKVNLTGTSSVPLYLSMAQPPKQTPYIIGQKEEKLNKLKSEAEKILHKFDVTNEGIVTKIKPEEAEKRKRKIKEMEAAEIEEKKGKLEKKENSKVKPKKLKLENEEKSDEMTKILKNLDGAEDLLSKKSKKQVKEEVVAVDDSDSEEDPDFEPSNLETTNENDSDVSGDDDSEVDDDDEDESEDDSD